MQDPVAGETTADRAEQPIGHQRRRGFLRPHPSRDGDDASSSSVNRPAGMMPALFTSTVNGASIASRNSVNDARDRTSKPNPCAPISAAALAARSASRSPMNTPDPLAAKAFAVARPIPRAPPVIATAAPSSRIGFMLRTRSAT
jgi:hypothetical protein